MNPLTSTIIDDESLLDQLRMYGETNLPLLPGQATSTMRGTRGKKPKNAYLNDSNRDIYLKKLNHYKAREKIETNPSVQYLKTQPGATRQSIDIKRISNIYKVHDDDIQEVEEIEKDDVIELDKTEYVQVVNGCTSPLSMSDYDSNNSHRFMDDDDFAPLSSTRAPSMGSQARSPVTRVPKSPEEQREKHGYVNLKDRIELDQTLSKYRADIENILHQSVRRNQREPGSAAARYLNDDILNNYQKSPKSQKITYVPKQEPIDLTGEEDPTFFDTVRSKFFGRSQAAKAQSSLKDYEGLRKREIYDRNEKPNLPPLPSKVPQSQTSLFTSIGNFISNAGMNLATFLPYLVFIILTVVALQYVHLKFMKSGDFDPSALETGKVLVNQIFDTAETASTRGKDVDTAVAALYCADIKDTKCAGTKVLLREMIDYLRQRSGQVDCTTAANSNPPSDKVQLQQHFNDKCVHLNELIDHLVTKQGLINNPELNQKIAIDSALTAISKNPHWEILMLDNHYNEVQDSERVNYLISLVSTKSLGCRLKELLYFIYVRIVIIGMGLIAMVLFYFVFKTYRNNRAAKDKEYYDLITKVTNMVEKQYELSLLDAANIKPYIAISHIYDSLVAPNERAAKKKLWNKIVNFIQDHESRIHLETQFINGEETHVWKWIVAKHESVLKSKYQENNAGIGQELRSQMMSASTYNSTSQHPQMTQDGRVETVQTNGWQGSAFNRKPQNEKPVCSPTPCLKVRNMFELDELERDRNLPHKIHNSILDKCMINNINKTILHIACDKKSREGCVYIKCASNDAAGLVYTALNGIWYNSKLLNVKFLRSDRYVERFPESVGYNHPIKPIKF